MPFTNIWCSRQNPGKEYYFEAGECVVVRYYDRYAELVMYYCGGESDVDGSVLYWAVFDFISEFGCAEGRCLYAVIRDESTYLHRRDKVQAMMFVGKRVVFSRSQLIKM